MSIQTLFFEFLQVSLDDKKCLSHIPSDEEWMDIWRLAQKHALVGVSIVGLENLSVYRMRPPQYLLLQWIGVAQQIEQSNKLLNRQCIELQKQLKKDGLISCILKGQGNAKLYGKIMPRLALLRQSGDIDVWVEGSFDEVIRYVESVYPTEEVNGQHIQFHFFNDTEVEIHFAPSRLSNRFLDRQLQQWFYTELDRQMSHEVEIESGVIVMPTDDFNIVYQMLHIYRHLFSTEGVGLRQLMDYYVLLAVSDLTEGEKNKVKGLVNSFGMRQFAESLMWVLGYVFHLPESKMLWSADERRGRFILSEVMQMGNFGHSDNRFKLNVDDSHFQRYLKTVRSKMRFLKFFPSEALWEPVDYFFKFFEIRKARRKARTFAGNI